MPTSRVLSVRVSSQERALLQVAAERSHSSVSDFVRHNALEAAASLMMDQRVITLSQADWEDLETQLAEPPERKEALVSVMNKKTSWED